MNIPLTTLLTLMLILLLGLILPELFKKLRIPFITSLIIVGAILGPNALNYVQSNEVIEFFGFLGMTFLMFMTGLETDLSKLKKMKKKIIFLVSFNGFIPFLIGLFISRFFGYGWTTSFLIGTIFISSSIAVVAPTLKSVGLFKNKFGQLFLAAVLLLDMISLVALSFILQDVSPITKLPLLQYFIIITLSILTLFFILPKLTNFILKKELQGKEKYERQLRFIIVIIMGVLAYFAALGVHPILAAFLVGLTLSHVVQSKLILHKFHTLGYGLFVPIFFFIVGMEVDLSILKNFDAGNLLMMSIILSLIFSKFLSGFFAAKFLKISNKFSFIFGSLTIIQITTTLAVTYAAASLGLLDNVLVTSIILMSVISTILGPLLLRFSYLVKN